MNMEDGEEVNLLIVAQSLLLTPFHFLISRPARRVYISTILLFITGLILAALAVTAYSTFYFYYVPQLSLSRRVHLQYDGHGGVEVPIDLLVNSESVSNLPTVFLHTPHDTVDLGSSLVSQQPYDVRVRLRMPRTPVNVEAGNFMVDLALLAENQLPPNNPPGSGRHANQIAHSRRPSILTYNSPLLETAQKLLQFPLLLFGWRTEAETVNVVLMEGISFNKGWRNIPKFATVKIESRERLWIYGVTLEFQARLKGIRYFMHQFRVTSFLLFTSIFWAVEMSVTLIFYVVFLYFFSPATDIPPLKPRGRQTVSDGDLHKAVKTEDEDTEGLSDTSRGFPTYSRQPPLHYSSPRVKDEDDDEVESLHRVVEADDEEDVKNGENDDEDVYFVAGEAGEGSSADRFVDSGLGTSLESDNRSAAGEALRRRRSGKGK